MTLAWSVRTAPFESASATVSWRSNAVASFMLDAASRWVWWVVWAHHTAVEVAPVSAPTSDRSAWAARRSTRWSACARSRVASARASAVSVGVIDHTGVWLRSVTCSRSRTTPAATGWLAMGVAGLLMGLLKQAPPTVSGPESRYPQGF
jgi:hypothetical protein